MEGGDVAHWRRDGVSPFVGRKDLGENSTSHNEVSDETLPEMDRLTLPDLSAAPSWLSLALMSMVPWWYARRLLSLYAEPEM